MRCIHFCLPLLTALVVVCIPNVLSAAMKQQSNVDCGICCDFVTGGSGSNCRVDIERCTMYWVAACPQNPSIKVPCGTIRWEFIACKVDTRPHSAECYDYTQLSCENAMPTTAWDSYDCTPSIINDYCAIFDEE